MRHFSLLAALSGSLIFCQSALPAVPQDGIYLVQQDQLIGSPPTIEILNGEIVSSSGFLIDPLCQAGGVNMGNSLTDLSHFSLYTFYYDIRKRKEGEFIFSAGIVTDNQGNFLRIMPGSIQPFYAELAFSSSTQASFNVYKGQAFFTGRGNGSTSCIGNAQFPVALDE